MKAKLLILSLSIICFVSCDVSKALVIDGQKEHSLSTDCGTVTLAGSSLPTMPTFIGFTFNGKYHINADSLRIEVLPKDVVFKDFRLELNNQRFTEKEITTREGETLIIGFDLRSEKAFQWSDLEILLLPSNFITCEGRPIITDTVSIQLVN